MPSRPYSALQRIYEPQSDTRAYSAVHGQAPQAPFLNMSNDYGRGMVNSIFQNLGKLTELFARAYAQERDIQADKILLDHKTAFEKWKADYVQKNTGKLGINALQDFGNEYGRLAEEALNKSGISQNEQAYYRLRNELDLGGLTAIKDGLQWQARQQEAWQQSNMEGKIANLMNLAATHADDPELIEAHLNVLANDINAKNPGMDNSKTIHDLTMQSYNTQFTSLLARGDLAGARNVIERVNRFTQGRAGQTMYGNPMQVFNGNPQAFGVKSVQSPQDLRGKNAGDVTPYFNNPGNVTIDASNFAIYATPEDGIKAAMERVWRYHSAKKFGNAQTLRQVFTKYAPPNENNTNAYVQFVSKQTGYGPDQQLDFDDAGMYAKVTSALLKFENHNTNMSPEQILPIAQDWTAQGKQKPKAIGALPRKRAQRDPWLAQASFPQENFAKLSGGEGNSDAPVNTITLRMHDQLQKAELEIKTKEAQEKLVNAMSGLGNIISEAEFDAFVKEQPEELQASLNAQRSTIMKQIDQRNEQDLMAKISNGIAEGLKNNLTDAQILASHVELINSLPAEKQGKVRKFLDDTLKNARTDQINLSLAEVDAFLAQNKGKSQAEIVSLAHQQYANEPEKLTMALNHAYGYNVQENANNRELLAEGMIMIDENELTGEAAINQWAYENGLTHAQRQTLLSYQGRQSVVSMSDVQNAFKEFGFDGILSYPDYLAVLANLESGRQKYSKFEIKKATAGVLAERNKNKDGLLKLDNDPASRETYDALVPILRNFGYADARGNINKHDVDDVANFLHAYHQGKRVFIRFKSWQYDYARKTLQDAGLPNGQEQVQKLLEAELIRNASHVLIH